MDRNKRSNEVPTPLVSRRERELLDDLALLKRQGTRITVTGFAKRNGYANKSALRHFPVLRRELSLYVAQPSAAGQRREVPLAVKYLESQIERQNRVIDRLKRQVKAIPQLKAKISKLEQKAREDSNQKKRFRGMLSTVIAFLSGSDFAKARDLSEELERKVQFLLEQSD
jgi:hypothetical protein